MKEKNGKMKIKVMKHLKEDVKESKESISEDRKLASKLNKKGK